MTTKLSDFEKWVIEEKGTEPPGSGLYNHHDAKGYYHCKKCEAPLYKSEHKFPSSCGWPSFDDEIEGAVQRVADKDGVRTEIVCQNCGAHLGHVFQGERLTSKNLRHCVNSVSMVFKAAENEAARAVFASGCFWGTEYYLSRADGVISTRVGYLGGHKENPTYEEVCKGTTGHVEGVEVTYDKSKTSYKELAKIFFETHDFSQKGGQGPDIGPQYLSQIFPENGAEEAVVRELIGELREKGYEVATTVEAPATFWGAEGYHQNYYENMGKAPYCHKYTQIFDS